MCGEDEGEDPGMKSGFNGIVIDDPLVLDTYRAAHGRRSELSPEKRLMLAVLEDGLACFRSFRWSKDARGRGLFLQAHEWFWSDDESHPFHFVTIAGALGLDVSAVRRQLRRLAEEAGVPTAVPAHPSRRRYRDIPKRS